MSQKTLNDFIYIKENAYGKSQELINYVETFDFWKESLVRDGDQTEARTSQSFLLDAKNGKNPFNRIGLVKWRSDVMGVFQNHLKEYLEPQKTYCEVSQAEPFFVLKYGPGQEYKPHSDGDTGNINRRISGLIYLNEEYEGGELYFPYTDLTIKPKTGMLILFPSNMCFPHASLPIKSGTKYALVGWSK